MDFERILESLDCDKAFDQFNGQPLVQKIGGADRASFTAGYETAKDNIRQALRALTEDRK